MATITEDFVSFETAKLLVKKNFGYNAEYASYYTLHGKIVYFKDNPKVINIAPRITLQMAMKWLRKVHKLEITPFHEMFQGNSWWYRIERNTSLSLIVEYEEDSIYGSYEQACEEAILYCLTNLI